MPYEIERKGRCYSVINTKTGQVHAKCTSMKKAEAQLHLLQGVEHGWKPTGKKAKPTSGSGRGGLWKDFVKKHLAGKKFSSRSEANQAMKKLSQEWKSKKGAGAETQSEPEDEVDDMDEDYESDVSIKEDMEFKGRGVTKGSAVRARPRLSPDQPLPPNESPLYNQKFSDVQGRGRKKGGNVGGDVYSSREYNDGWWVIKSSGSRTSKVLGPLPSQMVAEKAVKLLNAGKSEPEPIKEGAGRRRGRGITDRIKKEMNEELDDRFEVEADRLAQNSRMVARQKKGRGYTPLLRQPGLGTAQKNLDVFPKKSAK